MRWCGRTDEWQRQRQMIAIQKVRQPGADLENRNEFECKIWEGYASRGSVMDPLSAVWGGGLGDDGGI